MAAAFPLGKLVSLGVRWLSKDISKILERKAQHNKLFQNVCIGANAMKYKTYYHFNRVVRNVNTTYCPSDGQQAIESGSKLLGDAFVYTVAGGVIVFEWDRSGRKKKKIDVDQTESLNQTTLRLNAALKRIDVLENVIGIKVHQRVERERNSV